LSANLITKFAFGAILQISSDLFYQEFIKIAIMLGCLRWPFKAKKGGSPPRIFL